MIKVLVMFCFLWGGNGLRMMRPPSAAIRATTRSTLLMASSDTTAAKVEMTPRKELFFEILQSGLTDRYPSLTEVSSDTMIC